MKDDLYIEPIKVHLKQIEKMMEPYKVLAINTSINEMMKVISPIYSQINYKILVDNLIKTIEPCIKINISSGYDSLKTNMQEMHSTLSKYYSLELFESLLTITETVKIFPEQVIHDQIQQFQHINFVKMFDDVLPKSNSLSQIVDEVYTRIQDGEEKSCGMNDSFTEEELHEALSEQTEDPEKFQERVANWTEKKIKQYFIAYILIMFLWTNFVQPYVQENVGKPVMTYVVSNVKELPQKGAAIIDVIEKNIEAIITENTNYYYKVTYTDENGITKEGYVAKRNLKIIEEKIEEFDDSLNDEDCSQEE